MSHNITERSDGTAEAAFALKPAWHGLGEVVDHAMTSEEALKLAQLDWTVRQEPLYVRNKENAFMKLGSGHVANIRDDNDHIVGVVSPKYQVIQNVEGFAFLDRLHADGILKYESAFSLSGGRKVVLLARLPASNEIVSGDKVDKYILFSNSHDGTEGVRLGLTECRVVCQNTYNMALSSGNIASFSIRHDQSLEDHMQQALELIGAANDQFDSHAEIARKLADAKLTIKQWDEFLDITCPIPSEHDPEYTERRAAAIAATRHSIEELYLNAETCSLNGTISRTGWAAFNAVSQHVDHLPRRGKTSRARSEARFRVVTEGTGHAIKKRAFETVCSIAGVK